MIYHFNHKKVPVTMLLQPINSHFFKIFNFLQPTFFRRGGSSSMVFKKYVRIGFFLLMFNDLCERYFTVTTVTLPFLNQRKTLIDNGNSDVTVKFYMLLLLQTVTLLLQTVTLTVTLYCYRFNILIFN